MTQTSVVKNYIQEINHLHGEIFGAVRMTLDKAIRIGELLVKCKADIPHGEWMQWMKDNLEFSRFSAERYMKVYEHKAEVKMSSLLNLWEAEQALVEHKPIREPDYNPQQRVQIGKDVYEVGQGGGYIGIIPEAEVVPESIRDEGDDTGTKETNMGEEESTGRMSKESTRLKEIKWTWKRISETEKRMFLSWLKREGYVKIIRGGNLYEKETCNS